MSECKHGLEEQHCAICAGSDAVVTAIAERVILARWPGRCGGCDQRIEEGDPIGLLEGDWFCVGRDGCVRDPAEEELTRQMGGGLLR